MTTGAGTPPPSADDAAPSIVGVSQAEYDTAVGQHGRWHEHTLELYKLAVESVHRNDARRDVVHRFFLTAEIAMFTAAGWLITDASATRSWIAVPVCLFAIGVSYVWYRFLGVCQALNTAKFELIQRMEEHLPVQFFTSEWTLIDPARWERKKKSGEALSDRERALSRYRSTSALERWLPLFAGSAFALLLGVILRGLLFGA